MSFIKDSANQKPIIDNVFSTVAMCKKDIAENGGENVVNGTIGSLYDEQGKLVAYNSIFDHYKELPYSVYAAYAAGFAGNGDFVKIMTDWILRNNISSDIYTTTCATSGGTGAVSLTIQTMLDPGQTLLMPFLAWESYELMANQFGLEIETYQNFKDDHLNIEDIMAKCKAVMDKQHRILIIINDPAHNPSGYSMSNEEWKTLIDFFNELSQQGPVCVLNDIAYIDYCVDPVKARHYMKNFNNISDNVAVVIAASLSKTASSYGMRLGSAIVLTKNKDILEQMDSSYKKFARSIWSNVNNSAMVNFTWVLNNNKEVFLQEKQQYIDLLKQRSQLFMNQAKQCGLPLFPFKEGFFATIDCKDNTKRDHMFDLCVQNHIYICKVNQGLRVALCSLPLNKLDGLADKLMQIYKQA